MILKACLRCPHHIVKQDGREEISFCQKEHCFSEFTKCIARKALERFLDQEEMKSPEPRFRDERLL